MAPAFTVLEIFLLVLVGILLSILAGVWWWLHQIQRAISDSFLFRR